jgi:hypothetical protein
MCYYSRLLPCLSREAAFSFQCSMSFGNCFPELSAFLLSKKLFFFRVERKFVVNLHEIIDII